MKIAVLGGGVSGLSSAYFLLKHTNAYGGWIKSSNDEYNCTFENGPRTMRPVKNMTAILTLLNDLNLSNEYIGVDRKDVRSANRYIFHDKKLHTLPISSNILKKNSLLKHSLFYYAAKEFFKPENLQADDDYDTSVENLISNSFGREISSLMVDPLCKGIYAGNITQLSAKSCFPDLLRLKTQHKSIVKGSLLNMVKRPNKEQTALSKSQPHSLYEKMVKDKLALYFFPRGLETLIEKLMLKLESSINRIAMKNDTYVDRIEYNQHENHINLFACKSQDNSQQKLQVDHVISALPSNDFSQVLNKSLLTDDDIAITSTYPHMQSLLNHINKIPYVDIAIVHLVYKTRDIPKEVLNTIPLGFGHLIPSVENTPVLGVIYDWCLRCENVSQLRSSPQASWPEYINFSCLIGGAWTEHYFGSIDKHPKSRFEDLAINTVQTQVGLKTTSPIYSHVNILRQCIPQYIVGHNKNIENIKQLISQNNLPISLIGMSYSGVSVNHCVQNAFENVMELKNKFNI